MPFSNVKPEEALALAHFGMLMAQEKSDMAYIDHAVRLMEKVQYRFACTQKATKDDAGDNNGEEEVEGALSGAPERQFPYPSLFLDSPRSFVLKTWAAGSPEKPDERRALANSLCRSQCAPPPPPELLYESSSQKGSAMYPLDLTRPAANKVVTVLEGEASIGISLDTKDCYMMSPDATSCVLVACRASLNPIVVRRLHEERSMSSEDNDEDNQFVQRVLKTHTASMVHFNSEHGVEAVMEQLVWHGAVPAWLQTVAQHHRETTNSGECTSASVAAALKRLSSIISNSGLQKEGESNVDGAVPHLIEVQWFVVGGVRMKKYTPLILRYVLQSFFPNLPSQTEDGKKSKGKKNDRTTEEEGRIDVLSEQVRLSQLFGSISSSDDAEVLVAHRLREDGVCCWSFNTVVQPWDRDPDPSHRYASPICYGLLLDVSDGSCWPVSVQPGRRGYPLSGLRPLFTDYRWLCPLPKDTCISAVSVNVVHRPSAADLCNRHPTGSAPIAIKATPTLTESDGSSKTPPYVSLMRESVLSFQLFIELFVGVLRAHQRGAHLDDCVPLPFPMFLRRSNASWERQTENAALLQMPDEFFLQCSTTPHCEPSDFGSLVKQSMTAMMSVVPEDVFAPGSDGMLMTPLL